MSFFAVVEIIPKRYGCYLSEPCKQKLRLKRNDKMLFLFDADSCPRIRLLLFYLILPCFPLSKYDQCVSMLEDSLLLQHMINTMLLPNRFDDGLKPLAGLLMMFVNSVEESAFFIRRHRSVGRQLG